MKNTTIKNLTIQNMTTRELKAFRDGALKACEFDSFYYAVCRELNSRETASFNDNND